METILFRRLFTDLLAHVQLICTRNIARNVVTMHAAAAAFVRARGFDAALLFRHTRLICEQGAVS